jgi:hypothetical protein
MGNRERKLLELASGPKPTGKFEFVSSCRNADQYHGDVVQSADRSSIGIQKPGRQRSNGVRDVVSRPGPIGIRDPLGLIGPVLESFCDYLNSKSGDPLSVSARAERLAMQVKKKNAIIQRLRAGRKHSNWLRSLLRALPKSFQRRKKIKETHSKQMDDPAVSLTNSNQPTDADWRT